jgi:hypothetical protein
VDDLPLLQARPGLDQQIELIDQAEPANARGEHQYYVALTSF